MNELDYLKELQQIRNKLERLETSGRDRWKLLSTAITAATYEGTVWSSSYQTIDIPANYSGVPSAIRAAKIQLLCVDSGAHPLIGVGIFAGSVYYTYGPLVALSIGSNTQGRAFGEVYFPDTDGIMSFRTVASGTNTLTVYVRVWGWLL